MMKALTAIALLLALSELCERTSARSELCANGIILERRNRRSYAPRGERSALNARTGRRRVSVGPLPELSHCMTSGSAFSLQVNHRCFGWRTILNFSANAMSGIGT